MEIVTLSYKNMRSLFFHLFLPFTDSGFDFDLFSYVVRNVS